MNTPTPSDRTTAVQALPALDDSTIERIERDLFAEIGSERAPSGARSSGRRRTTWLAAAAAAAVVVVAAVIAPQVAGLVSGGGADSAADYAVAPTVDDSGGSLTEESLPESVSGTDLGAADGSETGAADGIMTGREVIATASATLEVADASAAAAAIGDAAVARGGYVQSMTLDADAVAPVAPPADGLVVVEPGPPFGGGAHIVVRVPADDLDATIADLSEIGEVTASDIRRDDVTEQAIDLRARVASAGASVERLSALLARAESVEDLIAAEQALADRQATLESYRQQLEALESQVALSSLTVRLVVPVEPVDPDPAGFADGVAAGWNGLIATLNGVVVALGFLLPWLVVAAIIGGVVLLAVRAARRRRARDAAVRSAAGDADATPDRH